VTGLGIRIDEKGRLLGGPSHGESSRPKGLIVPRMPNAGRVVCHRVEGRMIGAKIRVVIYTLVKWPWNIRAISKGLDRPLVCSVGRVTRARCAFRFAKADGTHASNRKRTATIVRSFIPPPPSFLRVSCACHVETYVKQVKSSRPTSPGTAYKSANLMRSSVGGNARTAVRCIIDFLCRMGRVLPGSLTPVSASGRVRPLANRLLSR